MTWYVNKLLWLGVSEGSHSLLAASSYSRGDSGHLDSRLPARQKMVMELIGGYLGSMSTIGGRS